MYLMSISDKIKEILKPLLVAFSLLLIVLFFSWKEEETKLLLPLAEADNQYSKDLFATPMDKMGIDTPDFLLVERNSFKSTYPPFTITSKVLGALMSGFDADPDQEIREYIIKEGDTLSSIASKFGVSVDTVAWANNIKTSTIQPGEKLIILPVTGVMHLVEKGDSVQTIAQTYKADQRDIIAFNDLSGRAEIFEGEILIIPDGELPSRSSSWNYSSGLSGLSTNDYYGQSHSYPYGQCTWWVAQKRPIPSWGNANTWVGNAEAAGYPVCRGRYCIPQVGAVIYLKGHRVYGHVAYVEKIEGDQVIFSEMNYIGLGKMNYRSLNMGSSLIQGYIY